MRLSVYTSCALNYLPKARALAESLRRHQPDARLTLCFCDIVPDWLDLSLEPFDRIWTPEALGYDRSWIFQHNVMELCTAVKGRALCRLIDEEPADLHLYLDPDVYLFSALAPVADMMQHASIGLVPHILSPEASPLGVELTELSVAAHGIYNLGHLVLRPDANGRAFAAWWAARLDAYCYDERTRGLFTDQRWVDLAPALFDGVRVLRTPVLDVASWNLSGRQITQTDDGADGCFLVDGEPLVTYHFSGTGPSGAHRRIRETFDPGNAATAEIERIYEDAIARHGQADLAARKCSYDYFDDATTISQGARRLYREHGDLRRAFPDPYVVDAGKMGYLGWLREHRPVLVDGVRLAPFQLERAFNDLFDPGFYLDNYPAARADVEAGQYRDALQHYCEIGSRLMFDPNEFFVSSYYAARAVELGGLHAGPTGAPRSTLLWHYLTIGLANGYEPIEFFDSRWYLENNPDIAAALRTGRISTPLAHYLRFGSAEGRDPGPEFKSQRYIDMREDARALVDDDNVRGPFGALVRLGGVEGRIVVNNS